MKVIKKGYETWLQECTCPECDSVLELEPNDLLYTFTPNGPKISDDTEEFWVHCGVCNHKIVLSEETIPKLLKKEVKNKFFKKV